MLLLFRFPFVALELAENVEKQWLVLNMYVE